MSRRARRYCGGGRFDRAGDSHPFALGHAPLAEVAGNVFGGRFFEKAQFRYARLKLPSEGLRPLPSAGWNLSRCGKPPGPVRISTWRVPVLALGPLPALEFLLNADRQLPQDCAAAAALFFWCEMARLSLGLVARHCLLPVIEEAGPPDSPLFLARWDMKLSQQVLRRLRSLDELIPAAVSSRETAPEEEAPSAVLDFLGSAAQAFVREAAVRERLLLNGAGGGHASPAEAWLGALAGQGTADFGDRSAMRSFSGKISAWLRRVPLTDPQEPFGLCLRLEPPPDHRLPWRLDFFLESRRDPAILLPAAEVWRSDPRPRAAVNEGRDPGSCLMKNLALAARVFPLLDEALRSSARPEGMGLSAMQAYEFLCRDALRLREAGFDVLVPAWHESGTPRLESLLRVSAGETPSAGLETLLDFEWQVSLGGERISREEFEEIVRLKIPLVRIRGEWTEITPERLDAARRFIETGHPRKISLREVLKIAAGETEPASGLPLGGVEASGWPGFFLEPAPGRRPKFAKPGSFLGDLRPYQEEGFSWLLFMKSAGAGACLADDMGLGKTVQLLAVLACGKEKDGAQPARSLLPSLIVCPMSIAGNWQKEAARFAPSLKVKLHHGAGRLTAEQFAAGVAGHDVVITTYGLAVRDREALSCVEWGCVVLDEAQNIKNPGSQQTEAVKGLVARWRVALTGTPLENRLADLWSIHDFLNPGGLGTCADFLRRYAVPIERHGDRERMQALKRRMSPFMLRRVKTDPRVIRDLPEKMEMKVYCSLTREQAALYEAETRDLFSRLRGADGIRRRGIVLAAVTKLKQICNHPAHFLGDGSSLPGRSGKLERLTEMIEEVLAEGDKALVFTQFSEMGRRLGEHVETVFSCGTVFFHGAMPQRERDRAAADFQKEEGPRVLIASLKAGGTGLNLTAACRVFHFDRWWNPAAENQATDRAFRIGQTKNVQVYKFVCSGTLEERIDRILEGKRDLAETVVGDGGEKLTELSADELERIIRLDPEAVGE